MQADFSTLHGRLRWAIDRQPREGRRRGLRLFQRRMESRAKELTEEDDVQLEGVALSSIQTYLRGEVVPPLTFLQEAAGVLVVREAWLILHDGEPTEDEERARQGPEEEGMPPGMLEAMNNLREGLVEEFPHFWKLPDSSRTLVWRLVTRAAPHLIIQAGRGGMPIAEAGRKVGRYLSAPFAILGIDPDAVDGPMLALMVEGLARPIELGMPHHPMSRLFAGEVRFGKRREHGPEGFVVGGAEETP